MAKKKGANATVIIVLMLIIGLAGVGVTNFGGSVNSVASVGDTEIEVNDYARSVQAQMRAFQEQTGQQITFQQAQAFGLDRVALGQLVQGASIRNEVEKLGFSIGDENVSREITSLPAFRNASGDFDRQVYELALRENNLDAATFEDRIRSDVSSGILTQAVRSGIQTPEIFTETLYNYARETRDITWARLTEADLQETLPAPSESDLADYHTNNPAAFTRPETKDISYAWISPEKIAGDLEVDETQLRALYDERSDQYMTPERRLVERLVFTSELDADSAKARLDNGEVSFDELVAERGLSLVDLDLGDVTERDLGSAGPGVFALDGPGLVGPLNSDFGPALFRMNGILSAQEVTFEDARQELQNEAALDRARRIILESVPRIEDLLAGGADPALLAERTDLEEGSIKWNTEVFDGISAYAGFRSAALGATPESFSEVIELDDGGIAVLKVLEVIEPTLRPLDEVRDQVIAAWTRQETGALLTEQANGIADSIRGGRDMAAFDLDLEVNREFGRGGFIEGTPPDFASTVFEMATNELQVLSTDGHAWLIRLDTINAAPTDTDDSELLKFQFSGSVAQQMSEALSATFSRALLEETPPNFNTHALSAVNSQLH